MNMLLRYSLLSGALLVSGPLLAGDDTRRVVIGGAVGGAIGALIGAEVSGHRGAVIGAGAGAALGSHAAGRDGNHHRPAPVPAHPRKPHAHGHPRKPYYSSGYRFRSERDYYRRHHRSYYPQGHYSHGYHHPSARYRSYGYGW